MEQIINRKTWEYSKVGEVIQTLLIVIGALLVPAVVPQILKLIFGAESAIASNSQVIVGTIVNTALIIAGLNLKGWGRILAIATLPSISAVSSGYIFGSLTKVTVFMIPGIWLGNLAIMLVMKALYANEKANYIVSAILAIAIKVAFIFGALSIWMSLSVLPATGKVAETLKATMGTTQLLTATMGAIVSYFIMKLSTNKEK